jgi:hypothetical protein
MVDMETARNLCLSLPLVEEYDHFGKPAYRVKKKIFATLQLDRKWAVVKLTKLQQSEWCDKYDRAVFPVENKWGQLGWTNVELEKMGEGMFKKLVELAWTNVAPKAAIKKHAGDLN